jgi:hypothetical protein
MHKFWVVLVLMSSAIALWFTGVGCFELWKYSRLDAETEAHGVDFDVVKKKSSSFAIKASYVFEVGGSRLEAAATFVEPYFLNEPAAMMAISQLKNKHWQVYYHKSDPSISSLQKNFPFKACIQAFLTLVVTFYFVFLRSFALRLSL